MRVIIPTLIALTAATLWSCGSDDTEREPLSSDSTRVVHDTVASWTDAGITVTLKADSPQFPDAALIMNTPTGTSAPGKVQFHYAVSNFALAEQTGGGGHCANSKDGQHIHVILNNEPYLARYTAAFEENLASGHYVCLSFLSRSYHESIKNGQAYDLRQFTVGSGAKFPLVDLTQPMLFYSRPKGEYVGADARHILLDFFLVNSDLSEDGYKVKLTVNDTAHFTLVRWAPYVIEGMPMGENTIELELVDAKGVSVPSLYNPVKRTVTLKPE